MTSDSSATPSLSMSPDGLRDPRITNRWLYGGLAALVAGALAGLWIVRRGDTTFKADNSFATLAGFIVLALVLERFCEAVLAPWWGTVPAGKAKHAVVEAARAQAMPAAVADLIHAKRRLGVSDARALSVAANAAKAVAERDGDQPKAESAADAAATADSAWVQATISRPTILLPAAGLAAAACASLHLFLLHGIAASGLPSSRLAYAADALISGLALAGGAKPFHDLIGGISK